tara:strand:+ start:2568 stop:2987 length:420 start_codon:yes stop_codon:yes gene_type:complete
MNRIASERTSLIRLAASLPKGSRERRTILSGLRTSGTLRKAGSPKGKIQVKLVSTQTSDKDLNLGSMTASRARVLAKALNRAYDELDFHNEVSPKTTKSLGTFDVKVSQIKAGGDYMSLYATDDAGQNWLEDGGSFYED